MVSLSVLPLCRVLLERTREERGSQVGFYGGSEAKVEAKGDNGSCRVRVGSIRKVIINGSCRVNPFYGTDQKVIDPNPIHF